MASRDRAAARRERCLNDDHVQPCFTCMDVFDRVARELEQTAQLVRSHGARARQVAKDVRPGPPSPSLQPGNGPRYELCENPNCVDVDPEPCFNSACPSCPSPDSDDPDERMHVHADAKHRHLVPGDATGEAGIVSTTVDGDESDRYESALQATAQKAFVLRSIVMDLVPAARDAIPVQQGETADEVARAGYCVSCYRVDRTLTPIATTVDRNTGNTVTIYSRFCRWCGSFVGEWSHLLGADALPPVELVRRHLTPGKRVTEGLVIEAMSKVARSKGLDVARPTPPAPTPEVHRTERRKTISAFHRSTTRRSDVGRAVDELHDGASIDSYRERFSESIG